MPISALEPVELRGLSTASETDTLAVQPKFTSSLVTLAGVEPGRKQMLIVEGWAEIRRLHRPEQTPIKMIAREWRGVRRIPARRR
jgi:hypothetical protein